MADIRIENHGSIFLFVPETFEGRAWLRKHTPEDALLWGSRRLPSTVVEPRYAADIIQGALDAGLEVR